MYTSEHLGSHLLPMSDDELIRLWVNRKSTRSKRFSWRAANYFLRFVEKPLARVTLADVQTFAALMRGRKLAPRFYKQTLVALKSLFAFGQQTKILPATLPLSGWPVLGRSRSKRLRFKLSWGLLICFCFFFGRMTPRLWGQSISPEGSLTQKRLPFVAASDSPSLSEHSQGAETAMLNSPDQAEDSIGRDRRVKAFLDTIATAEGTASVDGYLTQYTGTKFASFNDIIYMLTVNCQLSTL